MCDTQRTHLQTWSPNFTSSNQTKTQLLIIVCLTETNTFILKSSICAFNFTCYDRDICPALEVNEFIILSTHRQRKAGWSFWRPQNISGASQWNSVAAFYLNNWSRRGWKTGRCSSGIIQVSRSSEILNWFEQTLFTPLTCSLACALTPDGMSANTFSFGATVKTLAYKRLNITSFNINFRLLKRSPCMSVVFKNAATLFCCEAAETWSRNVAISMTKSEHYVDVIIVPAGCAIVNPLSRHFFHTRDFLHL